MSNSITIRDVTNAVSTEVRSFLSAGTLRLPADYSAENALKSASLMLPDVKDANKVPVLQSCTPASIKSALLSMVIQGLSPEKKQCYFVPYGETLTLQRSYFGSIAVAKRVSTREISDIYSDVVYKGDVFEYEKKRGVTVITQHKQKLENINKLNIVAAYVVVIYADGGEATTIMSIEDIKQAWTQSKTAYDANGNLKPGSTHAKFTAEMCKKTVVNKACKSIINSSDDSNLTAKYARQTDDDAQAAEVEEEISENANKIDVEFAEVQPESAAEKDPF